MEAGMEKFSMDIIELILMRLPVKSLLRFKCVSKTWYSLISRPSRQFINLHLQHSVSSLDSRLLILNHESNLEFRDFESNFSTVTRFDLPQSSDVFFCTRLCGSCNGLVAVVKYFYGCTGCVTDVVLWNPVINSYFILPHVEHPCEILCDPTFGFGYDSLNDDYKIIRLTDFCSDGRSMRQVMVYSSKKNSWGMPHDVQFSQDGFILDRPGVLIQNHIVHWIFSDHDEFRLRGFDLCSESWTDLPLPHGNSMYESDGIPELQVLDGCLCILVEENSPCANVWVMKEYGVQKSWTLLFTRLEVDIVGPLHSPPIAYSKDKHQLLMKRQDPSWRWRYSWFNFRDQTNEEILGLVTVIKSDVTVCVGSLVPVPVPVPKNDQVLDND